MSIPTRTPRPARRALLRLAAASSVGGAIGAVPRAALAQAGAAAWPSRPIRLVAVFPPGGSVDQVARILAPQLAQQLGQNVIVDNRGGASGAIGTAAVAQAEPDGHTWGVVFDTHAVNPTLMPTLPFDTRRDLAHVTLIGTAPMAIVASAKAPIKSFAELVAASRARQPFNYGSIGTGSLGHLAVTLLAKNAGFDWQHVPYRGGGPLMTDVVAGHVPLAVGSGFLVKPHVDARTVVPLVVTTTKRAPDLPGVPTVAESGFAGFDAPAWWGVIAPARTPPEIVRRMHAEIARALAAPAVAQRLDQQGIDVVGAGPEAFRAFVDRQIEIWARVVRDNDIKAGA